MSSDKSLWFLHYWRMLAPGLPEPEAEYRFHPTRRWRFDWSWVSCKVAVEIEGNAWNAKGGGRHMQDGDLEKYNSAVLAGWRVLRFSPGMLERDPLACVEQVKAVL